MASHRYRKDRNHDELVLAYESQGYLVKSTAMVGEGFPDVVLWHPSFPEGFVKLAEIKVTKGKLRKKQESFQAKGWPVTVARSVEDIA